MSEVVGSIAEIWRFPVKSMAGTSIDRVDLTSLGIAGDRRLAVRDLETGKVISAKQPRLGRALLDCSADLRHGGVVIKIGRREFTVAHGRPHGDVDAALSTLLDRQVRLDQPSLTDPDMYESEWPEVEGLALSNVTMDFPVAMSTEKGTFADLAALHIVTTSSLRHLAALAPDSVIDVLRFRPSIVIDTGDATGFVENAWAGRRAMLGGATLTFTTATPRCIMSTIDQGDLPRDPKVLQTLAAHNRQELFGAGNFACLGLYAEVSSPGEILTTDPLTLLPD
jgi:uncharacterized protein